MGWGAIPSVVVEYILDFIEKNQGFMDIYQDALVPEEGFIATIVMMSPYKDWIKFNNKGHSDSLTAVLNRSNGHPLVITKNDISELEASKFYFARKFDKSKDAEVVEYYCKKILV